MATTLAAVAFGLLFGIHPGDPRLFVIAATVLMTQFSISALNEWADRERDATVERRRPVPLGLVPSRTALRLAVLFGLAAFPGAVSFGWRSWLIVTMGLGVGWAYDLLFKPTPFSFLPFAVAFPLLPFWIGVVVGRPVESLWYLFLAGAPLALAIHLADAIPDREADRQAGIKTLAVVLGRPSAEVLAALAMVLGAALTFVYQLHANRFGVSVLSQASALLTAGLVGAIYVTALLGPSILPPTVREPIAKWGLVLWSGFVALFLTALVAHA